MIKATLDFFEEVLEPQKLVLISHDGIFPNHGTLERPSRSLFAVL